MKICPSTKCSIPCHHRGKHAVLAECRVCGSTCPDCVDLDEGRDISLLVAGVWFIIMAVVGMILLITRGC